MCFPLVSENPALANDVKLTTDMALMKSDGGGGKIKLRNTDITMATLL